MVHHVFKSHQQVKKYKSKNNTQFEYIILNE